MHAHADDLALDDAGIDGEPAIHRAVNVLRDDDSGVLVHLDVDDGGRDR